MTSLLASVLLLMALSIALYASVGLIRRTGQTDADRQQTLTTYDRTWVMAAGFAALSTTLYLDLHWFWIVLAGAAWLLIGWYIKWFGVSFISQIVSRRTGRPWEWLNSARLRDVPPRRIITRPLLILSIVWVAASMIFALITSLEADHAINLVQAGVTIKASVTDHRISTRSGRYNVGNSYDVRYQFSLDDGTTYTAMDATGRSDLWRSLPQPDYDAAVASGTLDVIYWPQNPWVNRPVHSDSADLPTLLIIDLFAVASVVIAFSVSRAYVVQRLDLSPSIDQ